MKRSIIFLLAFIPIIGWTSPDTYMGYKVVEETFSIAGGKTIQIPITDAGPIPAEDEHFKIEIVGLEMAPMKNTLNAPGINWKFVFTTKTTKPLERVIVEQVSPGDSAVLMLQDNSPELKSTNWGKAWGKATEQIEVTKESAGWLFTPKASIFIFKFTIQPKDESEHILYQATWFPSKTKSLYLSRANQLRTEK